MSDLSWSDGPLQPLAGVTVVDLSRHLPGPWLTRILSDLGATIIKIESPRGDPLRHVHPKVNGLGAAFASVNAGKQSVAVDMRAEEGRALLLELAARADILVESFRTGVLAAMGLDEATLEQANPRLIFCSLTGYGQTGPDARRAGHDINFLARAGLLSQSGPADGTPANPFVQVADVAGGSLPAVIGILAALRERDQTGRGRRLDLSMTRSVAGMGVLALSHAAAGHVEPGGAGMLTGGLPCYRCYPTGDGRDIALGALEPHFFARFCVLIGRPDLAERPFAQGAEGQETVDGIVAALAEKGRDEWAAIFDGEDVCVEAVLTPAEALEGLDEVVETVGGRAVVGLHIGAPLSVTAEAPTLGAGGADACRSIGADEAVVAAALESGALK
ncbi:MAG: alpha-methylacyl-CoA racemase [Myxococcota bacterium]|jgi:alpha-methylacyl-CoA racemase